MNGLPYVGESPVFRTILGLRAKDGFWLPQ